MNELLTEVREMGVDDLDAIADYWTNASPEFLKGMGADPALLPSRADLIRGVTAQIMLPYAEKQSFPVTWLVNGIPSGHSNVNKIIFGVEASMHLHLWTPRFRNQGLGPALIRKSLRIFFDRLQLQLVYSEPSAQNPSPNKALEKAGLRLARTYVTIPGFINFEQTVNRWEITRSAFDALPPI